MPCSGCGKEKLFSRGLCGGCYNRLRRNGSLARKYVINSGTCSVQGCSKASFAKNLCLTHYNKAQHPLRHSWKLLRSRSPNKYPKSWDSFDNFLADVGERPTPKHQLRRIDGGKPYSKDNIKWLEPVDRQQSMTKAERSIYSREWTLMRRFKITGADYGKILAEQGGVCAICGNKESHVYKSGKPKELSVDHCHTNGNVRGLLCVKCNRGLGYFDDNIERINRAIDYLRKNNA